MPIMSEKYKAFLKRADMGLGLGGNPRLNIRPDSLTDDKDAESEEFHPIPLKKIKRKIGENNGNI